ncbi:CinA family protein, partial [Corallococcus interemptor]|uniref:CinA family protein n=1 Tax=Corallococcus interemptor TaxID=2316720 RepID=UPI001FC968D4
FFMSSGHHGQGSAGRSHAHAEGRTAAPGDGSCAVRANAGGGTEAKPVGLVFIAVQRRGRPAVVERHRFEGDRRQVRQAAAARGLALLLEQVGVES